MLLAVTGNPIDGFSFVGPFDSYEAASEWSDRRSDSDWWIVKVEAPV